MDRCIYWDIQSSHHPSNGKGILSDCCHGKDLPKDHRQKESKIHLLNIYIGDRSLYMRPPYNKEKHNGYYIYSAVGEHIGQA